jgi:tRNA threonylcarbamoyladenosine biosynthesis protein TsaB
MTSRELFRADRLLGQSVSTGPVLGLYSGTPIASLALVAHGRVLGETSRVAGSHCATLPDAVAELLASAGVGIRELAGIAVAIGPGSFTGLRIALSYAKGVVAAAGCLLAGVPSLDAIALSALESGAAPIGGTICPLLDARKGEVYTALYRVGPDGLHKLSDDLVVTLEWLIARIPDRTVLAGDGITRDAESRIRRQGREATALTEAALPPWGRFVAALGAARLARGESEQAAILEPLYVRPPEATLRWTGGNPTHVDTEGLWSRERSI